MKESEKNKIWRQGFELGIKTTLKDNDIAIQIGRAILDALDKRYEFKKEDF